MQKFTVDDPETKSADIISDNVESLKNLFPDAFTEGKVDFEVLKQLLGGVVDERDEKYGLNWHGKRAARQLALTPSTGTLRPCPDESVDWDTTQNLMIEGDNLEVLKLLQKSYNGKAKLIYIDPPYNTGNDFVYPDDFSDGVANYLRLTGQMGDEGRRLRSNAESSGRFHTNWLSMILPRVRLAHSLLAQSGFIIVSIDDSELANLQLVLVEIFGEENHVATLVWDRNRKNDAKLFSVGHEYMVVFAKDKQHLRELGTVLREPKAGIDEAQTLFVSLQQKHGDDWSEISKEWREFYRSLAADDPRKPLGRFTKIGPNGPYRDDGDISWPGGGGARFEVLHPTTGRPCKVPKGGWVYSRPEKFWEEVESGRIAFGEDETTLPRQVRFLFESDGQVMRSVHYSYAQTATMEFVKLMGDRVFDNPKNWRDLARLVGYLTQGDDLIIDFFAGSGSTGHAVYWQNAQDNGRRRFILVQLPEPLDPTKKNHAAAVELCDVLGAARTISTITKERLRRAAATIPANDEVRDLGFRVMTLSSSNIESWDPDRDDVYGSLTDAIEHLKTDRSELDILFELLLKLGLELTVPIEVRKVAGRTVYSVAEGVLLVCLAEHLDQDGIETIGLGIVAWHGELAPAGDSTVVFRDSAFADDVAKTNLSAILDQHGLSTVRSL